MPIPLSTSLLPSFMNFTEVFCMLPHSVQTANRDNPSLWSLSLDKKSMSLPVSRTLLYTEMCREQVATLQKWCNAHKVDQASHSNPKTPHFLNSMNDTNGVYIMILFFFNIHFPVCTNSKEKKWSYTSKIKRCWVWHIAPMLNCIICLLWI